MSLGSCAVCWENPCMCGHSYEDMGLERLCRTRNAIDQVIVRKRHQILGEGVEVEPSPDELSTQHGLYYSNSYLQRARTTGRQSVLEEIRAHSSMTGLNVVISQNVLRFIEMGICPRPDSHEEDPT